MESLSMDWDSSNYTLHGMALTSSASEGATFSSTQTQWRWFCYCKVLEWNQDSPLRLRSFEDSSYARVVGFSAGQWVDISTPEMHADGADNNVTEISISLSDMNPVTWIWSLGGSGRMLEMFGQPSQWTIRSHSLATSTQLVTLWIRRQRCNNRKRSTPEKVDAR